MATDIAKLINRSARLKVDDLDLGDFRSNPLDPNALRCLRYMHDVEGHTSCYLRDVLVTKAHRDPEVSAFLSCWSYEEHWHGDAIAEILRAHGEPAGASRLAMVRSRLPKTDALRPLLFSIGSAITNMTAVHMTWGAINEFTTQAGYGRLAQKASNPVLGELLRRIMRQEGRHIDFYFTQSRERLSSSKVTQRLTRYALEKFWNPVGSGVMPKEEVRFLVSHLFGDEEGLKAARRIDNQVDRLPGLEGLHLVESAVASMSGAPGANFGKRLRKDRPTGFQAA
ncbi:MAG: ferritin-like domain-containing protein [Acidimicrobiales bacterium]